MESFWPWLKEDIKTPSTLIVLAIFAFFFLSYVVATLRGKDPKDRFILSQWIASFFSTWK